MSYILLFWGNVSSPLSYFSLMEGGGSLESKINKIVLTYYLNATPPPATVTVLTTHDTFSLFMFKR